MRRIKVAVDLYFGDGELEAMGIQPERLQFAWPSGDKREDAQQAIADVLAQHVLAGPESIDIVEYEECK